MGSSTFSTQDTLGVANICSDTSSYDTLDQLSETINDVKQPEPSFTGFGSLPPELRFIIWRLALPGPRVVEVHYHYTFNETEDDDSNSYRRSWLTRRDDDGKGLYFGEGEDYLAKQITEVVRINAPPIPLLHVNRESRGETLQMYERIHPADRCGALFDPFQDTIFLAKGSSWDTRHTGLDFPSWWAHGYGCCNSNNYFRELNYMFAHTSWSRIQHLAVDESRLRTSHGGQILWNLKGLKTLTIVNHEMYDRQNRYDPLRSLANVPPPGYADSPGGLLDGSLRHCEKAWNVTDRMYNPNIQLITPRYVQLETSLILFTFKRDLKELMEGHPSFVLPRFKLKLLLRGEKQCCSIYAPLLQEIAAMFPEKYNEHSLANIEAENRRDTVDDGEDDDDYGEDDDEEDDDEEDDDEEDDDEEDDDEEDDDEEDDEEDIVGLYYPTMFRADFAEDVKEEKLAAVRKKCGIRNLLN